MFQFPRFASRLREMTALTNSRVSPFGHPGLNACVPLPLAYRSLPRPSSPLCAQASSTCYRSLDYKSIENQLHSFAPKQSTNNDSPEPFLKTVLPLLRVSTQKLRCFAASALLLARVILPSHDLPLLSVVK